MPPPEPADCSTTSDPRTAPRGGKIQHEEECILDLPQLLGAEVAYRLSQALDVHRSQLLDHHLGCLPIDVDLRTERRRLRATRGRGDDGGRKSSKLVSLKDHSVPGSRLLVTSGSPSRRQADDIAPIHGP